ncbi:MAG TPA: Gfo/Idh/MocA family oxidoreductase [Anaerolineales bacterium]
MDRTKVGVIGAGYWGPNLIRNFNQIPESNLLMVSDLNGERLAHLHERYPDVRMTQDFREILQSDVEAVAIATPVSTHFPIAMECLNTGKNVMIEKPMACCSEEGQAIIDAGRAKGKVVMVGHTFLYNPAVMALREIIASGEIGRVYYVSSTRVNLGLYQPDTNVVWDLAPHDISILMYILGMDPIEASARGGMFVKPGVHDVAYLTLNFPGGVFADLRVSWLDPCKTRRLTIVGSKKMVVYDDIEPVDKVKIFDKGVDVQPYNDTLEEFHLAYRYGEEIAYPLKWEEPVKLECQHFLECVREKKPARSNAEQGLKVIQVIEAAQKSLFNGGVREEVAR